MLGIIHEGDGVAYRILQQLTRDVDTVRQRILAAAGYTEEPSASDKTTHLLHLEDRLLRLEQNYLQLREEMTLLGRSASWRGRGSGSFTTRSKPPTLYYGVKYHKDGRNHAVTKQRLETLENLGFITHCALRDLEDWGTVALEPDELMRLAFHLIDGSDLIVLDLTEKGVGLGIEAGYAHAQVKPVVTVVAAGSEISTTLQGISEQSCVYSGEDDLGEFFATLRGADNA